MPVIRPETLCTDGRRARRTSGRGRRVGRHVFRRPDRWARAVALLLAENRSNTTCARSVWCWASHLKKVGYRVENFTTGVIDYYGASGFSRDIKTIRDQIDEHFGVPVVSRIDAMTEALKSTTHGRLRDIIEPALRSLPKAHAPECTRSVPPTDLDDVLRAPLAGPGARLRMAAAV